MKRVNARERFDSIIADNRMPVGTFVMSTDPAVTAAIASAGPDFVVIDREHGPNDTITTANHVRAAEANGIVPIVRVLANDPTQIQATLDVGAHGIIVPKIGNANQAAAALAATRYQAGGRGMCPSTEGARWSSGDGWYAHRDSSNSNVVLIPLIETREGVENLAEIVAIDGIDYIFFGLADLSQDLDLPGGIYNPESARELVRIWNEAVVTAHAAGKKIGAPVGYGFNGGDFGSLDSDFGLLKSNLSSQLKSFRATEQRQETGLTKKDDGAWSGVDKAAIEREIRAVEAQWAANLKARNIDGMISAGDPDALVNMVNPGAESTTFKESRKDLEDALKDPNFDSRFNTHYFGIADSGELAYCRGEYETWGTDPQTQQADVLSKGGYIVVWKKDAAGKWKTIEDFSAPLTAADLSLTQ